MDSNPEELNDRELLTRILHILEGKHKGNSCSEKKSELRVYDNKAIMTLLNIKDKYLKKLRDNGYLGYSREGDKYWYTQEDVDLFLRRFHYEPYASTGILPMWWTSNRHNMSADWKLLLI